MYACHKTSIIKIKVFFIHHLENAHCGNSWQTVVQNYVPVVRNCKFHKYFVYNLRLPIFLLWLPVKFLSAAW
jgi:hypothetical protein